jgi:serine/threonine-protein kinase
MTEFWAGLPRVPVGGFTLVPAECIWIVAYPLIVPNTPANVLVASLLSASTGPAAVAISGAITGAGFERPLMVATYFLTTNYVCAVIAYTLARIGHHLNRRLKHAREIGSYELVERIGEGGMGEVWLATHRLLARPAAIKLIRTDMLGPKLRSREMLERRFEREARATATLRSTHTVDVYDFGVTEEGDFYYVMELLNGLSLERLVQSFGPIEPGRAVYLLRQVCHSLGEAHTSGLVHRDIKPANIFSCRLGPDDDFVKVLDFGLVKLFETTPDTAMLTRDGATAGTPAYMAPEIALGRPDVDGRADIYSLGCVAFYLLTGQPVFSADTPIATALAHVNNEPPPPSARSEFAIPSDLDSLILECLAKDPAARPPSAVVLGERLAATLPQDVWTAEAAHAWWQLHHVDANSAAGASAARRAADEPPTASAERRRCCPRLDSKRLTHVDGR